MLSIWQMKEVRKMAKGTSARVQWSKDKEASVDMDGGWKLCLQWVRYIYDDGGMEEGYRFIWRRPGKGNLQAARGQARIPSFAIARQLMGQAEQAGWGHFASA
jgi:hypothetical protein